MIRKCEETDFEAIWEIVNDGAQAYRGVIPADRWADPYMTREKLRHEIDAGVVFWGYADGARLRGVMGIQNVQDVTLIRHAYVRTDAQKQGIGGQLLAHLRAQGATETGTKNARPILIGTWKDAAWAIRFYARHGFTWVGEQETARLLRRYWVIPERQIETSVVLADEQWRLATQAEPVQLANR